MLVVCNTYKNRFWLWLGQHCRDAFAVRLDPPWPHLYIGKLESRQSSRVQRLWMLNDSIQIGFASTSASATNENTHVTSVSTSLQSDWKSCHLYAPIRMDFLSHHGVCVSVYVCLGGCVCLCASVRPSLCVSVAVFVCLNHSSRHIILQTEMTYVAFRSCLCVPICLSGCLSFCLHSIQQSALPLTWLFWWPTCVIISANWQSSTAYHARKRITSRGNQQSFHPIKSALIFCFLISCLRYSSCQSKELWTNQRLRKRFGFILAVVNFHKFKTHQ